MMVERRKIETKNNKETKSWEKERMQNRRVHEVQRVVNLGRGLVRSPGLKRTGENENYSTTNTNCGKKAKRKFSLLGENWGEETEENFVVDSTVTTPQSPPQGRSPL